MEEYSFHFVQRRMSSVSSIIVKAKAQIIADYICQDEDNTGLRTT